MMDAFLIEKSKVEGGDFDNGYSFGTPSHLEQANLHLFSADLKINLVTNHTS